MSPEQCDADPNDIDIRSDVYALGVVLYELLCDQPPYALRHAAIHEAARIIREEEPTKPSSLDKRLRGDIETIALKALEKDRDRRYQSATALEEDIDRYLAGDPITAKAPSAIDYLKRFARKHKAAAISIAAIFVVLVGAVIAISIFALESQRQRTEAEHSKVLLNYMFDEEEKHRQIAEEAQGVATRERDHALKVMNSTERLVMEIDRIMADLDVMENYRSAIKERSLILIGGLPFLLNYQKELSDKQGQDPIADLTIEMLRGGWDMSQVQLRDNLADILARVEVTVTDLMWTFDALHSAGTIDTRTVADIHSNVLDFGVRSVLRFDITPEVILDQFDAIGIEPKGQLDPSIDKFDQGLVHGGWVYIGRRILRNILLEEVWEAHRIEEAVELLTLVQERLFPVLAILAKKTIEYSQLDPSIHPGILAERLINASIVLSYTTSVEQALEYSGQAVEITRRHSRNSGGIRLPDSLLRTSLNIHAINLQALGSNEEFVKLRDELASMATEELTSKKLIAQLKSRINELKIAYEQAEQAYAESTESQPSSDEALE
jgi:hypothetical protein